MSWEPENVKHIEEMALLDNKEAPCNIWGYIRHLHITVMQMQIKITELEVKINALE